MTDPTVIIMVLAMYFCDTPDRRVDWHLQTETCSDGSKPHEWQFNLGIRDPDGAKDIVRIDLDGLRIFTMHDDGKTEQAASFNADENARRFWQSLRNQLPDICQALERQQRP